MLFFGNGSQCLIKSSPGMGPAAHYPDVCRQPVVTLVAVRMELAEECLREPAILLRCQHLGFPFTAWPSVRIDLLKDANNSDRIIVE